MNKIIKTRKTVRNYVFFNLGYLGLTMIVVTIASININIDHLNNKQILIVVFIMMIATVIILGLFWLFYQLLYGILLKKLNRNYKELARLEKELNETNL
jgi:predicted tellurium resistance membrane protein TerC